MSGHFRIERKETLEQRLAEKKKLTAPYEVRARKLVIGTRSSSDLVLDDPIAAEQHCAIVATGSGFQLQDLGSASGTYVNGARVDDSIDLHPGDRIALGVSTIEWPVPGVEDGTTSVSSEITLHVREGALFFAAKKRGEFKSDADEWVRSEVTFGRMPVLRLANVIAVIATLALAGWLWFAPAGEAALQPGHLSAAHAGLFSDTPPTDPHLREAVEIAQTMGCAACHESFGTPSQVRCAGCHGELVEEATLQRAHPFGANEALECTQCHREHHGAAPPEGVLRPVDIAEDCSQCHGDSYNSSDALREGIARAEQEYDLAPTESAPVARLASHGFESFDHGAHAAVTDCAACHKDADPASGSDFASLTYASCMDCHAVDALATTEILADWMPPDRLRWDLRWHGSTAEDGSQNCQACHEETFAAPLNVVETLREPSITFTIMTRSHSEQFHGDDRPGDCADCHKAGVPTASVPTLVDRQFYHEQHLSHPTPATDAEALLTVEQCVECHAQTPQSDSLVAAPDVFVGPKVESCAACHVQDGKALVMAPNVLSNGDQLTETKPAFPHDIHAEVEGSCLACHGFSQEAPGVIQTPEDVASCVRCHVETVDSSIRGHSFLAGAGPDACNTCHSPSPEGLMAAVFYGPDEATGARRPSRFPHDLEAHQGESCTGCHGQPSASMDIYSPSESAALCRECHAAQRFHWR